MPDCPDCGRCPQVMFLGEAQQRTLCDRSAALHAASDAAIRARMAARHPPSRADLAWESALRASLAVLSADSVAAGLANRSGNHR